LTGAAVGESDGSSDVAGGLEQSTAAGVGATVGAADRRTIGAVPRTVVEHVAAQAMRQSELIDDARLPGRTCDANARGCIDASQLGRLVRIK